MVYFLIFLTMLCGTQDLSSLIRDWAHNPCSESAETKPLDFQGIPRFHFRTSKNSAL